MRYFLSADGGGTKLTAVLFNDRSEVLGVGQGQAINYASQADIAESIRSCLTSCLHGYVDRGITIQKVYYAMPASTAMFLEILRQYVSVDAAAWLSEGKMALLAGLGQPEGVVALAGTGSGVFRVTDEELHIGGWGHLIGDPGSAYEIGREIIQSVLRHIEGREPATLLTQLFINAWQVEDREALIYHVYRAANPRRQIALAAVLGAEAAVQGDALARDIFERAGEAMAEQTNAMLRKYRKDDEVMVMIAGSAWKGCRAMYDRFCTKVQEAHPTAQVRIPRCEPALGGLFAQRLAEAAGGNGQLADASMLQSIQDRYPSLMYNTLW
ncbi:BadF/BadG/BcrA/BcrD ATPase family protein [Paenibacillus guangzhouensis]|uniref:BadF/BadG/BcrA/BcrD ATPase family protein n=1 Tax=Paenibacillus guangzhouensis TaxID=1473112 RepID=UPI001266FBCF|nr:BadF/BadG/BcrA/BcrD ATPase family protein [Paenibacillus guangzhouensis]